MADLHIRLTRDLPRADRTLGIVELDLPEDGHGFLAFGFSCEDVDRGDGAAKVPGETAIPVGTYDVRLYDSPAHGPDTPELVDVRGFAHVQVHSGNGPLDTKGCLLFGLGRDVDAGIVTRSRVACGWLRGEIVKAIRGGGRVTVEVRRAAMARAA